VGKGARDEVEPENGIFASGITKFKGTGTQDYKWYGFKDLSLKRVQQISISFSTLPFILQYIG
jgi:hypothetical protein